MGIELNIDHIDARVRTSVRYLNYRAYTQEYYLNSHSQNSKEKTFSRKLFFYLLEHTFLMYA